MKQYNILIHPQAGDYLALVPGKVPHKPGLAAVVYSIDGLNERALPDVTVNFELSDDRGVKRYSSRTNKYGGAGFPLEDLDFSRPHEIYATTRIGLKKLEDSLILDNTKYFPDRR